jgi:uncharacterized membrane protein
VLTKMFLYYLHERAWARIGWGVDKREPTGDASESEEGLVAEHV